MFNQVSKVVNASTYPHVFRWVAHVASYPLAQLAAYVKNSEKLVFLLAHR